VPNGSSRCCAVLRPRALPAAWGEGFKSRLFELRGVSAGRVSGFASSPCGSLGTLEHALPPGRGNSAWGALAAVWCWEDFGGAVGGAGGKAGAVSAHGDLRSAWLRGFPCTPSASPGTSRPPPGPSQAPACPCHRQVSPPLPRDPVQPPGKSPAGGSLGLPRDLLRWQWGPKLLGPLGIFAEGGSSTQEWHRDGGETGHGASRPPTNSTPGGPPPTPGSCARVSAGGSSQREAGTAGARGWASLASCLGTQSA